MNTNKSGIYKITNIVNNHIYIGSAVRLSNRWKLHIKQLRDNKHHSIYLQNAWNKHTETNFRFDVIVYCSKENLIKYEQIYFNIYNPKYNMCKIAGSPFGYKHTDEMNQKASKAKLGSVVSEETKQKISEANKGHKHSSEYKEKMSKRFSGITNPFYGKKHSKEAIEKNKIAHIGNKATNQTKQKMSENRQGEDNKFSKLTWKIVDEIRQRYEETKLSQKELAKIYSISRSQMNNIINNKQWIKPRTLENKDEQYEM